MSRRSGAYQFTGSHLNCRFEMNFKTLEEVRKFVRECKRPDKLIGCIVKRKYIPSYSLDPNAWEVVDRINDNDPNWPVKAWFEFCG